MRLFIRVLLLFLFIVFNVEDVLGQKIVFNYDDSGRVSGPGYSKIEIVIERTGRYCEINVFTDSGGVYDRAKAEKWRMTLEATETKEDSIRLMKKAPKDKTTRNTYELTIEELENIVRAITSIDPSEISKDNRTVLVYDGYSCEIEYNHFAGSLKYKMRSPGYKGKKRIPNFSKACRLILEAANIKPRKVL